LKVFHFSAVVGTAIFAPFRRLTPRCYECLIAGMNWKSLFQDIGKGYTTGLGRSLLALTGVILTAVGYWAWNRRWSDKQLLSIPQTSLYLCLALLVAWGWCRFFLAWKKIRKVKAVLADLERQKKAVEEQLAEALKQKPAPAAPDPFAGLEFDRNLGVWKDKTHLAYCPFCKANGRVSPMRYTPQWYYCAVCSRQFSTNPNYKPPPMATLI
jgi:hypothetical protein